MHPTSGADKNVEGPVQSAWYARISSAAIWRALRCATSTAVPAMLGAVTGNHEFGWAALGGFEATLADLGGSYQARFTAMGLLSIGGAFGLFLGMISGSHLWSVLLCTVVWSFIWSYATVLGGTVSAMFHSSSMVSGRRNGCFFSNSLTPSIVARTARGSLL